MFIDGVIADGGGDFNVVTELAVESTVLLVVDSVMIGCAWIADRHINDKIIKINLLFICTSLHG
jgi:hypothetical protein